MSGAKLGNALVIGKKNRKVDQVAEILRNYFSHICRVKNFAGPARSLPDGRFHLIVITDALDRQSGENFVNCLRKQFPRVKILGLFDTLSPELEKNLRRTGVIFLGSYEHFGQQFASIFSAAFNGRKAVPPAAPVGAAWFSGSVDLSHKGLR